MQSPQANRWCFTFVVRHDVRICPVSYATCSNMFVRVSTKPETSLKLTRYLLFLQGPTWRDCCFIIRKWCLMCFLCRMENDSAPSFSHAFHTTMNMGYQSAISHHKRSSEYAERQKHCANHRATSIQRCIGNQPEHGPADSARG